MVTRLEPSIQSPLRQAESADTRLSIRRDEKRDGGSRHDDTPPEEQEGSLWQDTTRVSTQALKAFLTGFLKEQMGMAADPAGHRGAPASQTPPLPETTPASTAENKKAASAYQTIAARTAAPPESPAQDSPTFNNPSGIENEELRLIMTLIEDIETLIRSGVEEIVIEREGTFLQSIASAVNSALK